MLDTFPCVELLKGKVYPKMGILSLSPYPSIDGKTGEVLYPQNVSELHNKTALQPSPIQLK